MLETPVGDGHELRVAAERLEVRVRHLDNLRTSFRSGQMHPERGDAAQCGVGRALSEGGAPLPLVLSRSSVFLSSFSAWTSRGALQNSRQRLISDSATAFIAQGKKGRKGKGRRGIGELLLKV